MTIFVLLTAIVLVLLAVSIHLGAMRSMNALMPRWPALNFYRVGILILVAIIAHLLEISLFAIGLGWLVSSGAHGQLDGAYQPGFTNDFYYSAITYTALGFGDITPTDAMRLFSNRSADRSRANSLDRVGRFPVDATVLGRRQTGIMMLLEVLG